QPVVSRAQVGQVLFAVDRLPLACIALVATQVEGEAHRTKAGNLARTAEVVLLLATPAVDKQHARELRGGRQHGALQLLARDRNLDGVQADAQAARRSVTRLYLQSMPACPSSPR